MAEVVKMLASVSLVLVTEDSFSSAMKTLHDNIWQDKKDLVKISLPAFVYLVQNNLLYTGANNLDPATYQVTYQLKILTTALFATVLLGRALRQLQWVALVMLSVGVATVQLAVVHGPDHTDHTHQNKFLGLMATVAATCCSGFAGVYVEKILKCSNSSIWMKNVQLSLTSLPFGLLTAIIHDWNGIMEKGFFFAYDGFTLYLIMLNATGGLLVSIVVKWSDNILKNFASSIAIVLSMLVSIWYFGLFINLGYIVGTALVIASVIMYSCNAPERERSVTVITLIKGNCV